MPSIRLGPRPEDFIWAGGIEDTFVPQARSNQHPLDEYALMGHYEHWREDLALLPAVGAQAVRWGVPWYRVEPEPGRFDWSWTDQVIPYLVEELGITPILDLMHYGCPLWLQGEFANLAYPQAVASYATAFAARYAGRVRWYTPHNEPIVTALMCGRRGLWPPYLRGDAGYIRILLQVVRGALATVAALKAADPGAIMVHVEAGSMALAARPDLAPLAAEAQLRAFLPYDLLTGRVTPEHPLFPWLVRHGAPPDDLAALAAGAIPLDVLGLNFYPQWATREFYIGPHGRLASRTADRGGAGFAALVGLYQGRYGAPVLITETSARGAHAGRARWLAESLAAIRSLRGQGVPVLGYTWFPLFTMIDWRYRNSRLPPEMHRVELGLFRQNRVAPTPRWLATPLAAAFRAAASAPDTTVGPLVQAP